LKAWFKSVIRKTAKFIDSHKLEIYADIVILVCTFYLLVKKVLSFTITGWLLNNALHQPLVNKFVYISVAIILLAVFIKIISILIKAFPVNTPETVEPEHISSCLQTMNNEIVEHLKRCDSNGSMTFNNLTELHMLDVNVRMIINSLVEHIKESVNIKLKNKDVFISLYKFKTDTKELHYELHYDHKRDIVSSKIIPTCGRGAAFKVFKEYECVKCINSANSTAYTLDKQQYQKGNSKRHKTVRQYMGCKLEANGDIFGFLNIEFHNQDVFPTEEDMQDYMENNVFPFKLLLEYQYLKRKFFSQVEQSATHIVKA